MKNLEHLVPHAYDKARIVDLVRRIRAELRLAHGVDVFGGTPNVVLYLDSLGNLVATDTDIKFSGLQLQLAVQGNTGGLLVGGDVQWYRSAADTWRTPDSIIVDVDATVTGQLKVPTSGSSAGIVLGGDAQWYRSAADTLRTPDKVVIDSTMESSNYPLQPPYDIVGMFNGIPDASIDILRMEFPRSVTLPASLTGSIFEAETAATGSTTFDIKKNGSSVGSANFAGAATAATFTFASDVTFAAGDKLEVVAPGTPDATLANLHITFKGYRA